MSRTDVAYFGRELKATSIDELGRTPIAHAMMAVLMNSCDETQTGLEPVPNEHIAAVRKHPDVFIGFGAPIHGTAKGAGRDRRCAEELGLRGIGELHGARQGFAPNDPRFYPLWEEAAT